MHFLVPPSKDSADDYPPIPTSTLISSAGTACCLGPITGDREVEPVPSKFVIAKTGDVEANGCRPLTPSGVNWRFNLS
jgi:hypothetical protein